MSDKITFEEFVTLMAKKMDIPINTSVLNAWYVGIGNSKLKVNIPRHMQGIKCPDKIFGKQGDGIIFDDVKGLLER